MISNKKTRSILIASAAFSSVFLLSGCSWLKIDSITDTVNYRGNSGSIANLEVPPGLTTPIYDPTYTIAKPVSAADVPPPTQAAIAANTSGNMVMVPASGGLNSSLSTLKDGNPVLVVDGRYDQVWAKTGQILSRMGFVVSGQQYEQGIYTVSSSESADQEKDKNVISRFMSYLSFKIVDGKKVSNTTSYRFIIAERGEQSLVVVSDEAGAPVKVEQASLLLARLKAELAQ